MTHFAWAGAASNSRCCYVTVSSISWDYRSFYSVTGGRSSLHIHTRKHTDIFAQRRGQRWRARREGYEKQNKTKHVFWGCLFVHTVEPVHAGLGLTVHLLDWTVQTWMYYLNYFRISNEVASENEKVKNDQLAVSRWKFSPFTDSEIISNTSFFSADLG